MIKPEWGAKRQCPKCNTRFYDLGAEDPVHCIACGNEWTPEPILKSKQPLAFESQPKPEVEKAEGEDAELTEDIDLDEAAAGADEDEDLGGEDELADVVDPDSEEEA